MAYRPEPAPFEEELAGLDALEAKTPRARSRARRIWSSLWPKVAAVGIVLLVWQILVWAHWRPKYVFPGPGTAFRSLWRDLANGRSLITGLQTMPSVAWFPLAIVVFRLSETAILFVVVLGAAPAIANGLVSGIDHVPPLLLRAGRVLGARGVKAYRHVILPAAFPSFLGGMKQGWAFAWRSLMAGELLVVIGGRAGLGFTLDSARLNVDYPGLMATMIVILVIGIVVDSLLFGVLERRVRRRWGLIEATS
ncbi:MAG: ABC transporter permease subunit [Actinobacteria bacterium]|nr:MAG: ABC transporter permease subunit [Actinomycetota bacterium]